MKTRLHKVSLVRRSNFFLLFKGGSAVVCIMSTVIALPILAQATSSRPGGPVAARILFKKGNPGGSFAENPTSGTPAKPGSGLQAIRVFNADGSLLASGGPTSESWPKWLTSVEIGISGANNSSAPDPDCARMSKTSEQGKLCDPGRTGVVGDRVACGAPSGWYRVSEVDCTRTATKALNGNGGASDGVYIRATFSRDPAVLGANENIQAILEYSSNVLNSTPSDPSSCFSGGKFDPLADGCMDQAWHIYLKHSLNEVVQPFLMISPTSVVDRANKKPAGMKGTKQWIIPLARDANLSVLQISRNRAMNLNADAIAACHLGGAGSDVSTAHCLGMVFYSLTFIRM